MYKFQYNIEQRRNGKLPVPALFILLQTFNVFGSVKVQTKLLTLRVEEICVTRVEFLISAKNTGIFVVPKGKGGQRRAIKLNPAQRAMIAKYVEYAKAMGLQPGCCL
jgi:hypothetical protein